MSSVDDRCGDGNDSRDDDGDDDAPSSGASAAAAPAPAPRPPARTSAPFDGSAPLYFTPSAAATPAAPAGPQRPHADASAASAEEVLPGSGDVDMLATPAAHASPSLRQPYDPDSDDEAEASFGDVGSQGLDNEDEAAAAAVEAAALDDS